MTVTGTTARVSSKTCVMPTLRPSIPIFIRFSRGYRSPAGDLPATSTSGEAYAARGPRARYFVKALISTSTPGGRLSFMSASTVCGVGS